MRQCAKLLRAIGETWPSSRVTAGVLVKDLGTEIEKQKVSFLRSPNDNTFPIPSNSRITASPPAAIPVVSSQFVVPKDDLGAADTVVPAPDRSTASQRVPKRDDVPSLRMIPSALSGTVGVNANFCPRFV